MCSIGCSIATTVIGAILVVGSCILGFIVVPNVVEDIIIEETVLIDDTVQMERFQNIPFPLTFNVRMFNITNPQEVLSGSMAILDEIGPYVYKLYQTREILDKEHDIIRYIRHERFEFDPEASYPLTEDDMITIVNIPYHAIIQIAERSYPNLLSLLNLAMGGVFGVHNSPIATFRVRDLLLDGVPLCTNPGITGTAACAIIRSIGANAQNLDPQPDGSLIFSALAYKQNSPSLEYEVLRGLNDHTQLAQITRWNNSEHFRYWPNVPLNPVEESEEEHEGETEGDEGDLESSEHVEEEKRERVSVCNMINGTDAGIFQPLIDRNNDLYAINTDICRSVLLKYQFDSEYKGIPTVRYAANEWLLDNDDGCFCLNTTTGINREDGCLLKGAMELYECVGAYLVMSYPHFLFADDAYRNGVIGMSPDEEIHKIFMDLEPNTGTPVRGFKRAQFNIFMRPIGGVSATANLNTSLVPFMWIEEGVSLPDEFVDELTTRLLNNLRLVDILVPVLVAICCLVFVLGVGFLTGIICKRRCKQPEYFGPEIYDSETNTTQRGVRLEYSADTNRPELGPPKY